MHFGGVTRNPEVGQKSGSGKREMIEGPEASALFRDPVKKVLTVPKARFPIRWASASHKRKRLPREPSSRALFFPMREYNP
jgi:hypothetical protein